MNHEGRLEGIYERVNKKNVQGKRSTVEGRNSEEGEETNNKRV